MSNPFFPNRTHTRCTADRGGCFRAKSDVSVPSKIARIAGGGAWMSETRTRCTAGKERCLRARSDVSVFFKLHALGGVACGFRRRTHAALRAWQVLSKTKNCLVGVAQDQWQAPSVVLRTTLNCLAGVAPDQWQAPSVVLSKTLNCLAGVAQDQWQAPSVVLSKTLNCLAGVALDQWQAPRVVLSMTSNCLAEYIRMPMCCDSARVRLEFQVCGGSAHGARSANQH